MEMRKGRKGNEEESRFKREKKSRPYAESIYLFSSLHFSSQPI